MRTITLEEHFVAAGIREIAQSSAPQQAFLTPQEEKLADLDSLRLQDMNAGGIDLQVISHGVVPGLPSLPTGEAVRLTRAANDQLATAIAAHPNRFAGFATLPMSDPEAAVAELERAVRSLGLKGAMINGTTDGRFLDDPSLFPILEQAVALDVPIYIHPAEPPAAVRAAYYTGFNPAVSFSLAANGWGWHSEVGIHTLRLILAGVFDRLPALQIIIGDRILFSVDYPYSTNEQGRTFLDNAPISLTDKEKLSHLNAERLLKLNT